MASSMRDRAEASKPAEPGSAAVHPSDAAGCDCALAGVVARNRAPASSKEVGGFMAGTIYQSLRRWRRDCDESQSLFRVQRMLGLLEELVLQLQGLLICLDGFDRLGDLARPGLLVELAELFGGRRSNAGIVLGKLGVPPDAGVNALGQFEAVQVGA